MNERVVKYKTKKISIAVQIIPLPNYRSGPKERAYTAGDRRKLDQGTLGHYGLVVRSVRPKPEEYAQKEWPEYLEHYFPLVLLPTESKAQQENLLHIIKDHIVPNLLRYWDLTVQ